MYDAEFENEAPINGDMREWREYRVTKCWEEKGAKFSQLLPTAGFAVGNSTIVCFSRVQRMLALNKAVV